MKRLSLPLVAVIALLALPGSALAASARPLSHSTLAYPAAFTVTPGGNRILYGERFTGRVQFWHDPQEGVGVTSRVVAAIAALLAERSWVGTVTSDPGTPPLVPSEAL